MATRHDRTLSLALAHARLRLAAESLRWALSAESAAVIDREEVRAVAARIESWGDDVWKVLRDSPKGGGT